MTAPSSGMLKRAALLTTCVAAGACVLPAVSGAAAVTPASFTDCSGSLSPDATGAKQANEPNLLNYSFHCDTGISAYSVIVDQDRSPLGAITDYDNSPVVYMGDGITPAPGESVTCEGTQPSNGINCSSGAQNLELGEYNFVDGTIDLQQAYCAHLPTTIGGKPPKVGTLAVPTAKVQLIVTDDTGAEDGPFDLKLKTACPKVPAKVTTATTTTTKTTKKSSSKRTA